MNKNIMEKITDPDFCKLLSLAEKYFDANNIEGLEYHQCLALKTEQREMVYSFACDSVKELVDKSCDVLTNEKISAVHKIVCMWEGGGIDSPAYRFMTTLCELNGENKNAQILLNAGNGEYIIKRICDIIKL